MKNEAQSKPAITQTQPLKTSILQGGSNGADPATRPVRLNPVAIFSACVSADSSFRF